MATLGIKTTVKQVFERLSIPNEIDLPVNNIDP
ncbi:MAG: hypothetical protein N5P05_001118 [Chroococcopsis gigantea SAG 12.99]|jgi:hypothetical protein|nr:hypothetical protein [Chroococcopsis gigantea SAG 12.99]